LVLWRSLRQSWRSPGGDPEQLVAPPRGAIAASTQDTLQNRQRAISTQEASFLLPMNHEGKLFTSTDFTTPEYCAIRATICFLDEGPTQDGDAIDLVDWFLNLTNTFEQSFDEAAGFLRKYFPLDQMA
jgi:hypothetical protein